MKKMIGGMLILVVIAAMIAGLFFEYAKLAILVILSIRIGLFIALAFNIEKE